MQSMARCQNRCWFFTRCLLFRKWASTILSCWRTSTLSIKESIQDSENLLVLTGRFNLFYFVSGLVAIVPLEIVHWTKRANQSKPILSQLGEDFLRVFWRQEFFLSSLFIIFIFYIASKRRVVNFELLSACCLINLLFASSQAFYITIGVQLIVMYLLLLKLKPTQEVVI